MINLMKHFPAEEWIDFVSRVGSTTRKEKMNEHLEQGCKRCSYIVSLWQQVRQIAENEANYRPPGNAVRIAKASFAGSNLTGEQERRDGLAELVFDSFLRPVLEGARSSSMGTRHMLYRADPFQIDLLIESQASGRSVVVTGQLLDLRYPVIVGHDLRVTLSNLRGRVVHAATNQFGEFCQEIENSGNLELKFHGANHQPVVIWLRDDLDALRKWSSNVP
jgi:hypothetical protein